MKLTFSSLQWMVFILAGSLVAPIAIGDAFGMTQAETADLLQRSFFIIGVSAILQVLFGHKLPINEGPAGLWWGVFTVYAGIVASGALTVADGLQQLTAGMLISGILFFLLGAFRIITSVRALFTPLVTGTYLILLVSQLSGSFIKGMLGIGYLQESADAKVAIASLFILVLSIVLGKSKVRWLRSYSILISLILGWGLFKLLDLTKETMHSSKVLSFPEWLAWGTPELSGGAILTSLFVGLLLLTNMVASINVVEKAYESENEHYEPIHYNRASIMMGLNTWIAGLFSAVASVPISGASGFILTTKMFSRLAFILGNAFIIVISFFPPLTFFFAGIPAPVGYATIFLPFSSMIGLAFREYKSELKSETNLFIISTSLMVGIGSLFIPAAALKEWPSIVVTLLSNGLIMGMLTCMALEQFYKRKSTKKEQHS
ncbi:purine/pyrimidine permease [Fictibacillus phosphorivorans]|uniref:purine/pyrimidine permease n=1 Tax=Fictibacillus phosphorivorans TaxID=1221500 RepID=UPI00203BD46F|nr:purine/pyrimidine permease [Fictibacillus phosphorivorans]MCM3719259.1 purine/pyrimidine permease [Fictibacillus phosphorivorans]MCM3776881.1 purine/pyrimidine permease [Fictibacillus phosphorivorans]